MYLTFRRAKTTDFEDGFAFVKERYGYADSLRKDILRFWGCLLENGHEPMTVVEDRDLPAGERQVAFGTSFFASDDFVKEAKTTLPPYIDLRALEKWRSGQRPYLLKDEIIQAQLQNGVNAVSFNWGWDTKRYNPEDTIKIMQFQSQSYLAVIVHYRLKEFLQEVFGFEKDLLMNLGVDLARDYKEFLGTPYLPQNIGEKHPYLVHCVMSELVSNPKKYGTMAHRLVCVGPPRFGFVVKEQEVLKKALLNETDEEIALSLNVALVTVKKRWQSIYAKVDLVDPELLSNPNSVETDETGGQKQRRRFLLKSLTEHPEEFWPHQLVQKPR